MKHIILHCKDVGKSREFVNDNANNYTFVDWMDLEIRQQIIDLFNLNDQNVQDFPSVILPYPQWFKPEAFFGDEVDHYESGYEVFCFEVDTSKIAERLQFLNKRSKGYIYGIEVPDVDTVVWGSFPEAEYGYITKFDGWEISGQTATRKFRFDKSPIPTKPPVVVLGED